MKMYFEDKDKYPYHILGTYMYSPPLGGLCGAQSEHDITEDDSQDRFGQN